VNLKEGNLAKFHEQGCLVWRKAMGNEIVNGGILMISSPFMTNQYNINRENGSCDSGLQTT
jgi:hypothetical protein